MASAVAGKVNITLKMEESTKNAFRELCDNIGISMSAAMNALMKQAVRQQRMDFSLLDENGFSPAEAAELKRRADDVKAGRIERHSLIEV